MTKPNKDTMRTRRKVGNQLYVDGHPFQSWLFTHYTERGDDKPKEEVWPPSWEGTRSVFGVSW